MKVACLQFAPELGKVDDNIKRATAILSQTALPADLDWLVLPELAFSGDYFSFICFDIYSICDRALFYESMFDWWRTMSKRYAREKAALASSRDTSTLSTLLLTLIWGGMLSIFTFFQCDCTVLDPTWHGFRIWRTCSRSWRQHDTDNITGYNFQSLEEIKPYLEPTTAGISTRWAISMATTLKCHVTVGYPEGKPSPSV
jgi:hypothetical protein